MSAGADETPGEGARKLLIVTDAAETLGGATLLLNSLIAHRSREWKIGIASLNPGPLALVWARSANLVVELKAGRMRQLHLALRTVWRLRGLLRSEQPDLVLSWMPKAHLYVVPAAWLAGVGRRVAWRQSGGPPDVVDRVASLLPTQMILAPSQNSAREQERLWPYRRAVGLEPGIEEPEAVSEGEVEAARERFGLPESAFVVGMVGRLQRWKGQNRLLEAIAALRAEGRDVHGLLVGGDPGRLDPKYGEELRDLVGRLGLDGAVTMTGHQTHPQPLLPLMDVMVNASESEPFGLVLLEAMLAGVPVIAANAGGPADLILDGVDGVLMQDASSASIAAAVRELMDDPDRRRRLAAAAPVKVRDRYLAHHFAQRVSGALADLWV